MKKNQLWKSKDNRDVFLKILDRVDDDITVTFDLSHIVPRRVYKYKMWYIDENYEKTESTHQWTMED